MSGVLTANGLGVIAAGVCGQLLFGMLAALALVAARRRAGRGVVARIALILVLVESFALAIGGAALNSWRHGSLALTGALLWYAGVGWGVVQIAVIVWIALSWWKARRDRPS